LASVADCATTEPRRSSPRSSSVETGTGSTHVDTTRERGPRDIHPCASSLCSILSCRLVPADCNVILAIYGFITFAVK